MSGATGPFDYALGVFHLESGGQFENDDSRQTAVNLRLGLTLPYDSGVTFTLRWNETNTGLPVKFVTVPLPIQPIIDKNNENLSDTLVTGLELRTHPVSWWESVLRGGRYFNINKFVDLPLQFHYFFARKVMFVRYASAFVVFPGLWAMGGKRKGERGD